MKDVNEEVKTVNVLLYTNCRDQATNEHLIQMIEPAISGEHLEIFQTDKDLVRRANRFPIGLDLAVLLARSDEQLSRLVDLKDLLDGVHIILILPDMQKHTISKGLALHPRYFSCVGSNFEDVAAVLKKMLRNMHSKY